MIALHLVIFYCCCVLPVREELHLRKCSATTKIQINLEKQCVACNRFFFIRLLVHAGQNLAHSASQIMSRHSKTLPGLESKDHYGPDPCLHFHVKGGPVAEGNI